MNYHDLQKMMPDPRPAPPGIGCYLFILVLIFGVLIYLSNHVTVIWH